MLKKDLRFSGDYKFQNEINNIYHIYIVYNFYIYALTRGCLFDMIFTLLFCYLKNYTFVKKKERKKEDKGILISFLRLVVMDLSFLNEIYGQVC